jgi:hypothetical protein
MLQGERGHAFYIVESGQLSAFKDNQPLPVMSYGPGRHYVFNSYDAVYSCNACCPAWDVSRSHSCASLHVRHCV